MQEYLRHYYFLFLILRLYEGKKAMLYLPPTPHTLSIRKPPFYCSALELRELRYSFPFYYFENTLLFITVYWSIGEIIKKVARVVFADG